MLRLNPLLRFNGQACAALGFYSEVFGGSLVVQTYADWAAADPSADIAEADLGLVVAGYLKTPSGFIIETVDWPAAEPVPVKNTAVSLSLEGDPANVNALTKVFTRLSEGATNVTNFADTGMGFWFGSLVDKFGVTWEVAINPSVGM
ncbi:MAG: hypothetical protein LBH13_05575 [Cellulomonadaceae bacterium]|nr:hypothetical protein [Cellulomonadaceae bacterium]